jgi:hypothetical protein
MKKIVQILLLLLSGAIESFAQQPASDNNAVNKPVLSIAISPLSLIEIEPTANLQVMYNFHSKYAAAIEVGRIIKTFEDHEDDEYSPLNSFTGWRFRPEFRFISSSTLTRQRSFYMAIQGLLKVAKEQSYVWVHRSTLSGLSYREAIERTVNKTVTGLSFIVGKDMNSLNTNKAGIDYYSGLGFRYKHFKDNIGSNFNSPTDYGFNNKRNGFSPTVLLGIRCRIKMN